MHTNSIFESDDSHPRYSDPYGANWPSSGPYAQTQSILGYGSSRPSSQPATWHSGPYPQTQSILEGGISQLATWQSGPYPQARLIPRDESSQPAIWQPGPYPQARPILGGGNYPHAQSTWQSGPYPQNQSMLGGGNYPQGQTTWQSGPHPQTQSILGGGNYPQAQSTWQSGPHPQTQSILGGGNYPQAQSTWQSGPHPQTQSILGGGNYPQAQSTWQSGPYPQNQSILGGGNYPRAQSTWELGPHPQTDQSILGGGNYPQAQSTWQSGPHPQTQSILGGGNYPWAQSTWELGPHPQTDQSILGGGNYPQAQSTWQSGPHPQTQSILGVGSYPQAQSAWQPSPYSQAHNIQGGEQPMLADQQEISLASIKNDEERIDSPDVGTSTAGIAIKHPKIILDFDNAKAISKVERIVDPDSESSSLCCACRQPIFSTPSISFSHGGDKLFLHEQCDCLPLQFLHELHLHQPLILINQLLHADATVFTCHNCNQICGTSFYRCPKPSCDFRLDLLCVLQIKIKHRSHKQHAMTVIRQRESSSLTCGACDTKHQSESEALTLSYLCNLCGYWIHPDCASLLNALHYKKHQHSLFLIYNLPAASTHSECFICSQVHKTTSGVFVCLKCTDYFVHINCAIQNPHTFKPVLMRDAKASDLGRLPMANEHMSLIPYIRHDITEINSCSSSSSDGDGDLSRIHAHPLIFHETDDADQSCRVCNACVQYVSPPFYSCSECPDFFLHGCCAHLPTLIDHRAHEKHHLALYPKAPKSDKISAGFCCKGCHLWCNGFAYSCITCDDFTLDVVCALINPAITHEPHKSTHILFMSRSIEFGNDEKCNCCNSSLNGICYECSNCPNFKLHVRCALLPNTVGHVFDQHPLRLTTTATKESKAGGDDDDFFCEVCEKNIDKERWHYSCSECNQLLHVDCIPSIDQLSRIKLGSDVRVDLHSCPVALVRRDDAVCAGRRCGSCREILKLCDDGLAYECSNCFFGLHQNCAKKRLLKS